jgi:flagella basal body P-ring formation protein FlgA
MMRAPAEAMFRAVAIFMFFVALVAAGAVFAQSVTPVRAIRAQTILSADDLALQDAAVQGGIAEIAAAVGREARVTLYPGRPILTSQIGAPALIERNQLVRMTYARGALSIVTEGRALDRAGEGELVRVMNLASRQTVTGTVAADGTVEVGP